MKICIHFAIEIQETQETAEDSRYDQIAKGQHNWRRSTKYKHKRRGKHKIQYDLEQTK